MEGIASYYAEPYNGRRTASGEIFDAYKAMTAAHRTLPFDTVVRVTNQANGRRVDVRINDRGPFIEGRVIDRYEAARARDTLEWAALCAGRDREKAEAVARVKAALPAQAAPQK